ncbi:hypothetical protein [Nocardiopsis listeri]|uniref:hypothetical protein n=1 Tax=Nocardiopsis listeri TaxID=53440 RepID=UPI0008333351|nr:hypothetical protein [Nocardiopsis listeri]
MTESPSHAPDGSPRNRSPWPARVALTACAALVVGAVVYGAAEVSAALNPPSRAPAESADEPSTSERTRTTLLSPDEPEEERVAEEEPGGEAVAPAGSGAPAGGQETAPAPPASPGEDDPGRIDPRREVLDEILDTPQERPPMEPLITQEELDAMTQEAESAVVPQTPAPMDP